VVKREVQLTHTCITLLKTLPAATITCESKDADAASAYILQSGGCLGWRRLSERDFFNTLVYLTLEDMGL